MMLFHAHTEIMLQYVKKITKFIPSYCGLQMNTEINALKKITSDIKKDQLLA